MQQLAARIPDTREIIRIPELIQSYTMIDHNRVWMIAESSLPGLRLRRSHILRVDRHL